MAEQRWRKSDGGTVMRENAFAKLRRRRKVLLRRRPAGRFRFQYQPARGKK